MADFVVCSDNNIYCDYFDVSEVNKIGSLTDSAEHVAANHKRSILANMPVLNDPKCQVCPVIGLCWGNCCNMNGLVRPSEMCDREGLYNDAKKAAEEGQLIGFMYRRSVDKTM
jgi:radical SAM protein with 4Fe4S-binding SPASM domain